MIQSGRKRRRTKSPEHSGASSRNYYSDSRKSRERKSVRWHLVFYMEVALGLAITWAVLALIYYLTDPQVMAFREWFR